MSRGLWALLFAGILALGGWRGGFDPGLRGEGVEDQLALFAVFSPLLVMWRAKSRLIKFDGGLTLPGYAR